MSRDLEENTYYISQGGLVPIKWTAPEVIIKSMTIVNNGTCMYVSILLVIFILFYY